MNGLSICVPRLKIVRLFYFQILPDARNNIPYNFLTTHFFYVRKSTYVVKETQYCPYGNIVIDTQDCRLMIIYLFSE